MSDYISRNRALKYIADTQLAVSDETKPTPTPRTVLEWLWEGFKDMPSADATEVVRCEDCKYCTKGIIIEQRADGYQKIVNECNITKPAALVALDHYCGYGKRLDTIGE